MQLDWVHQLARLCLEPWSEGQRAFALVFALGAFRVCCLALMIARFLPLLPAWNRACKKVFGLGWFSLSLDKSAGQGGGHPAGLALMLALCSLMGLYGLTQAIGANGAEQAARWAAMAQGGLLASAVTDAFYALAFSLGPLLVLSKALRDESSQVGGFLQEEAGYPLAKERARKLGRELGESCGPAKAKGAARRL